MKYVSKHVKRMREIDKIPKQVLVWKSSDGRTYVKKIHGCLTRGLTDEGKKTQQDK